MSRNWKKFMHAIRLTRCLTLLAAFVLLAGIPLLAADNQAAAQDKEKAAIEVLLSGSRPEKALACKQLAVYGTKQAVPELAPLLADEELASWARIALEAIPDPSADDALRKATDTLKGKLLIGAINSLGVRRDAGAVDRLKSHLKDDDADAAAAAAVALGHIGNAPATVALRRSLSRTTGRLRSAVAEGCILCAERLMEDGKEDDAAEIYEQVRKAELPKQIILEATRGEILARRAAGIPLLIEQLRSEDKKFFQLGLKTARELQGPEVADALAAELSHASTERAALLLHALADRTEHVVPPAVVEAAKSGPKPVRIAAIEFIGRWGEASSVPALLQIASEADKDVALAAKTALGGLHGDKVNAEIAARLADADTNSLAVLIELVGQRRIAATPELVKALHNPHAAIRRAALTALGNTVGPEGLSVLIAQVVSPKESGDLATAQKALRTASIRMPDRDSCAAELAAGLTRAPASAKAILLEIIGEVGGPKALEVIGTVMKSGDPELQDIGTRALGGWMSVDAAPVLLDLAKNTHDDKYQGRAIRGYIRLARQFAMPARQRAEMCQTALDAATRPAEQKLVLAVLQRFPSADTLEVAIKALEKPGMKEDARQTIVKMAQKLNGKSAEAEKMLAKAGIELPHVQIVKAEYGAGTTLKDVTQVLQAGAGVTPRITLPSPNYNESFGGDPAPGVVKQLKVRYQINGKAADATFAENAAIDLPVPK
jgi:HEAT repeat protein